MPPVQIANRQRRTLPKKLTRCNLGYRRRFFPEGYPYETLRLRRAAYDPDALCLISLRKTRVAKYYSFLPIQILSMTDKERSSSVPMMYIGAAKLATAPYGDLVIQSNLNALMYPGLADYKAAMRAFQTDLGDKPTGELTVGQIHQLGYRAERSNLTEVSFFLGDFGGSMVDNWATVEGTSIILGENIAYPVNHVSVKCDRARGICEYRQIVMSLPDSNSFVQMYDVGEIADETYRITRWEGRQIDAVPVEAPGCRINQLSFNFETKEYFEIARNNSEGDCETLLGVTLARLEKPRISQIVDGGEIISAEFKKLKDEAYGYFSSDFRARAAPFAGKGG